MAVETINVHWGVWCEVWGGVTGSRQAWARANDKILLFDTQAEAEAWAKWTTDRTMGDPHRVANFRYTAMVIPGHVIEREQREQPC